MADTATTEPTLMLHEDMLNRAVGVLDGLDPDMTPAERRELAEEVIRAAFEGVPIVNYGIGLALQSFKHVIGVGRSGGAIICERTDEFGFDTLAHHLNLTYGAGGQIKTMTFSKIGVES